MAQQAALFGESRQVLVSGAHGTIAYIPALFSAQESIELFGALHREVAWTSETMYMYDRVVDVPRLVASYPDLSHAPAEIGVIRARIEGKLGVVFSAVGLNYYRSGSDSVAWHSDKDEDLVADPTVALVSLGAARTMRVRTKAVPRTYLSVDLEPGSLFVMQGAAQQHYEHHIPKAKRPTEPRISVVFRTKRR
ncbi:MAG: alpha-ketoglutarate-dependent dioxygenase AlkB [Candidatus Eremiobacteraeota bacterium]|nr:alpha-ketoglutarate-dependent dioxygenase AlkB [Candidatus Eremiobacteraeota bacterium]